MKQSNRPVLLVHGTGVREEGFHALAAAVAAGLRTVAPLVTLEPCIWGPRLGAKLHMDGKSIPRFHAAPQANSNYAALWEVLALDPMFELREIAAQPRDNGGPVVADSATLSQLQDSLHEIATAQYAKSGYRPISVGIEEVSKSDELASAVRSSYSSTARLRGAVARAIVARATHEQLAASLPTFTESARDDTVRAIVELLGGAELGLLSQSKSLLKGIGDRAIAKLIDRKRDVLFAEGTPMAGDILLYQAKGELIREYIGNRIDECGGEVVVLAHSLGGVACVDLLAMEPRASVKCLITIGSQAPLLYELGALRSLSPNQELPLGFPATWVNVYCQNDLLSCIAAPVFGPRAIDIELQIHLPFPQCHSAYWSHQPMWTALAPFLTQSL